MNSRYRYDPTQREIGASPVLSRNCEAKAKSDTSAKLNQADSAITRMIVFVNSPSGKSSVVWRAGSTMLLRSLMQLR